jgi:hypothetical protein
MQATRKHFAVLASLLLLTVLSAGRQVRAQNLELGVPKNKVINGFEAQLRGDYRESNGSPTRITAELDHINIPIGTPIAFCVQDSVTLLKTKIGVGRVRLVGGVPKAEVERRTSDGQVVPRVTLGDKLQARQAATAPFQAAPGCGSPLLISGTFQ